jgi:hypothetical protein
MILRYLSQHHEINISSLDNNFKKNENKQVAGQTKKFSENAAVICFSLAPVCSHRFLEFQKRPRRFHGVDAERVGGNAVIEKLEALLAAPAYGMLDEIIDREQVVKIVQVHGVEIKHALFIAGKQKLARDGLVFEIGHEQGHHAGKQRIDALELFKRVRGSDAEFFLVLEKDRVKFVVVGVFLDAYALVYRLVDLVAGIAGQIVLGMDDGKIDNRRN